MRRKHDYALLHIIILYYAYDPLFLNAILSIDSCQGRQKISSRARVDAVSLRTESQRSIVRYIFRVFLAANNSTGPPKSRRTIEIITRNQNTFI